MQGHYKLTDPLLAEMCAILREQSKQNIKKYIDERLPEEYEKCLVGISSILKEAWNTANSPEERKDKLHALSLAKDCYSMKLELLTNATIVEDALKFVDRNKNNNNKQELSSNKVQNNNDDDITLANESIETF